MKSILYKIFRLKIIKILAIIGILIIAVINIHNIYTDYLYRNEPRGLDSILPMVINSVIGIPYYNDSEMQNSATDIIKFPKEDWLRFKCIPAPWHDGALFKERWYIPDTKLSNAEALQLRCLGLTHVDPENTKTSKTINGELCNNIFNCQIVNLQVKDYVLSHPEILWNIVKIAERPCNYVRNVSDGKNKKEQRDIYNTRRSIHCNGNKYPWYMKERIFIIITIFDSKNSRAARIVVRRTDID